MGPRKDDGITDELRHFIEDAIDSIGTLEVLLLLRERHERAWGADEVSRELRSNPTSARQQLDRLTARRLVRKTDAGADALFLFDPSPVDAELISRLARQYAERKVTVIGLIYERRSGEHLRVFSDAFKLRKD